MVLTIPITAFAHSGRTDSSGGHKDNKNKSGLGSYHYHCGGYPAHLHSGGVCPYKNSSSTSYTPSYSSKNNTSSTKNNTSTATQNNNSTTKKASKYWKGDKYWNGEEYVTGLQEIKGKTYLFDDNGNLIKNAWYVDFANNKYYATKDGTIKTGWLKMSNGKVFYLGKDGTIRTGLRKIGDDIYFFDTVTGARYSGWLTYDNDTYFFDSEGKRVSGKIKIGEKTYSFDENGILKTKTKKKSTSETKLKWGMSPEEVIAVKDLDSYIQYDTIIQTVDMKVNNCYLFDNEKMFAYGKIDMFSSTNFNKYKNQLLKDGWEYWFDTSEDGYEMYYFVKDSKVSVIMTDLHILMKLSISPSYIEDALEK